MNKVALIAQQGSGTNLLRNLLNSHPDISFHGEVYLDNLPKKEQDKRYNDWLKDLHSDLKLVGLDIKYNQLTDERIKMLKDEGWNIIHLIREPVRTAVKGLKREGQSLSYTELQEHVRYVLNQRAKIRDIFKDNMCEVSYEGLTGGYPFKVDVETYALTNLLEWLGVENKPLKLTNEGLINRYDE